MPDFGVLLDAPAETARRIQIARLGPVSDPRYGDFEITADDAQDWQKNLGQLPGQRALIDFEHRSEKSPRNSEAAGWITGIELDGEKVMADVEWSDKGQDAIVNKRYLFLSPAYGKYRNERGETFDNTLCSVGLTNKPVLGSLPMLTLASEERVSEAIDADPAIRFHARALEGEYGEHTQALVMLDVSQAERDKAKQAGNSLPDGSYPINNTKQLRSAAVLAASGHGDAAAAKKLIRRRAKELGVDVTSLPGFSDNDGDESDSRRAMANATPELLKVLDLPEDADEATILEAVTGLKDKADKPAEPEADTKTLEQQATEQGKKVLDQEQFNRLVADATAGAQAAKKLHEQTRDALWGKALESMVRTNAQHENFLKLYELDADAVTSSIEDDIANKRVLLNAKPIGSTEETDAGTKTLSQRIDEVVADKGLPYDAAYLLVLDEMSGVS